METLFLFILGAIAGSFLNVLGMRFNSGLTLGGRSQCSACGKTLGAMELVPLASFLILRGRCKKCGTRISWQYPLVELSTAIVFVSVPLIAIPVFCLYIAIAIYDLRHKIIPDPLVYSAIALSLGLFFISSPARGLADFLAGPMLFSFFALIWLVSSGRAMGFGDAKLALSIGWLLGAESSFSAVLLAFWAGALFGIGALIFARTKPLLTSHKKITMKSEIPFAPFLVFGAWLSAVLELDLLHVSLF